MLNVAVSVERPHAYAVDARREVDAEVPRLLRLELDLERGAVAVEARRAGVADVDGAVDLDAVAEVGDVAALDRSTLEEPPPPEHRVVRAQLRDLGGEVGEGDAAHVGEDPACLDQAALLAALQVDLRDVAGDHGLRAEADAREEHLHLLDGRVLRLIEDDEGVIQ
jgi:hypothetical protein